MLKISSLSMIVLVALTGCASPPMEPPKQAISVQTVNDSQLVSGITCELANDRGRWTVTTPGTVEVITSQEDLVVTCTKPNNDRGTVNAVARPTPSVFVHRTAAVIAPVGAVSIIEQQLRGIKQAYPSMVQVMLNQDIIVTADQQLQQSQ